MTALSALYRSIRTRLAGAAVETAAQEARILLEGLAGITPQDFVRDPDKLVAEPAAIALHDAVSRRIAGEPVYRILGWREFYGLRLALSPDTLEPRPDTETLVEAALPFARARIAQTGTCRILDLGTGTGAIALSLLSELPDARALATDIAPGALETARRNAAALGLAGRLETRLSAWFDRIDGVFDLIVSNPPYIVSDVMAGLAREVRDHDPVAALDGGPDGLDAYRAIAAGAPVHLAEGGLIALEIGFDQAESVTGLLGEAGFAVEPVICDLGGNDRVLRAKMRQ